MKIIYIHGFASTGNGDKCKKLRELYKNIDVISPSLDPNPEVAVSQLKKIILETDDKIILIGTSLGGFYATYFAALYDIPSIIINPVTNTNVTNLLIGTHNNLVSGEEFTFTEEYVSYLNKMESEIKKADKKSYYFNVVIGGSDRVLTFESLPDLIPYARTTSIFPDEGHRFSNIDVLKPLIDQYVQEIETESNVTEFLSEDLIDNCKKMM